MNLKRVFTALFLQSVVVSTVFADQQQPVYCPQNSGYINVGMTPDQVVAACGMPISQQDSDKPATQRVQVQQLFFNNQGHSTAFYGVWAISGGASNYVQQQYVPFGSVNGGGGVQLEVDIVNNQVQAIKLNGAQNNAISVCGGVNISVGDPVGKVSSACGSPSVTNNTYMNIPIQSKEKPKVWVYQMGQYQTPMTLTFVNGRLITIEQ